MALFIQSGNALVSRVAQWVGAVPSSISINATALASNVITTSASTLSTLAVGDMIGYNIQGPFTLITAIDASTVTVNDPDATWASAVFPTAILKVPTNDTAAIYSCIQMAELKMRTLELPALRSDPYSVSSPTYLTVDSNGLASIPVDMNWPILFFQDSGSGAVNGAGPWIIYDRVGDREIIRLRMVDKLYVRPSGVPKTIRGSFSEVANNYVFTPNPGAGTIIKAYYYKTFQQLFTTTSDSANPITQTNPVLASFPEGYFYSTLWAYYAKNKNDAEAQKWDALFNDAYGEIEDQNSQGKWKGGDLHLTSEFQPRVNRYNLK